MFTKTIFAATFALVGQSALAQDAPTADTVMATVNGTEITLGHMILVRDALPSQLQSYPDQILFDAILTQMIDQTVLASAFEGSDPLRVQLGLENEARDLRASELVASIFDQAITDEAIEAAYQEEYASQEPAIEYLASHILLEDEATAVDVLAQVQGGLDFATAATQFSTGPSGPRGGSLGWFGRGAMVGPFDAAVADMQPGTLAGPVQTQFGWHIINLVETRPVPIPSIDEVRDTLADQIGNAALDLHIAGLTEKATIVRSVPEDFNASALSDDSLLED